MSVWRNFRFCPSCGRAESTLMIEQARFDYDCPRCGLSPLSTFYSVGSKIHEQRLFAFRTGSRLTCNVRGDLIPILPPPPPDNPAS